MTGKALTRKMWQEAGVPDRRVRGMSLHPLTRLAFPRVEKFLRRLFSGDDGRLAAQAGLYLAQSGKQVDRSRLIQLARSDDDAVALEAAKALGHLGAVEGANIMVERSKKSLRRGPEHIGLLEMAEMDTWNEDQRRRIARLIVNELLPKEDDQHPRTYAIVRLCREWSKQSFGYLLGGDAERNNPALARWHEWAGEELSESK